jgi:prepilin-type N-terminal cleavage/methylation domain-containing protein
MISAGASPPRRRRVRQAGYSLVEVLITLVIMAMLTGLLFQGIGGAAQMSLRLSDQADRLDRTALAADWLRTSIASALPEPKGQTGPDIPRTPRLVGAATSLSIVTIAALHARPGTPRAVRWELTRDGATTRLIYEAEGVKWTVAQSRRPDARFVFRGEAGASLADWSNPDPPQLVTLENFFDTPVIAHPRSRAVAAQPPERPDAGL